MSTWQECRLGDVAEVQTGPFGSQLHLRDYKLVGIPIVTVEHIGDNRIVHSDIPLVGEEDRARLIKYSLKTGDIVFSRVGSVDRSAYVHETENGWMFSGRILRVRSKPEKVNPRFLSFYFSQESFKETIRMIAVGATMPSINTSILSEVDILLPPLPEQFAITGVLSSLDDKIDLLHQQNKTLEGMAEALWRKLFIEDADPSWKKGKLGDEMKITMGQSPPGNTYNEEKQGLVFFQGRAEFDFRFPQTRLYCTEPKRLAKKGNTLVSVRAPVGDINMAYEDCCIGRGLAAVIHKNNYVSYTYYKVRSFKYEFDSFEQQGTVFGSIGKDDFNNLNTLVPSEDTIQGFENTAKPLDDKILTNSIQIRTLSRLRDSLLPRLISGEVRVKLNN
jgi:type I restriction enzyme, S subunit